MEDRVYQKMWDTLKKEVQFNIVELEQMEDESESPGLKKAQNMMDHLEKEFIKNS